MLKRMFHLLLAFLMVVSAVSGTLVTTANAAVEKDEEKWTLVEFTWEEERPNRDPKKHTEYALVGEGNGEDAFVALAPRDNVYRYRFAALAKELKEQGKEDKRLEEISLVQIKGEPESFTYNTGSEEKDNKKVTYTDICFNGESVAKVDGDVVFIFVTWSMDDYEAKPEEDDAELYLYHSTGCMDEKGEKRDVCPSCRLITIHDKLSCGHRSCVDAYHARACCGVYGHMACYGNHGYAGCGLYGHLICVGVHYAAPCRHRQSV